MANTINCIGKITSDEKIQIEHLTANIITIDISRDIDFTDIVQALSEMIGNESELVLNFENDNSISNDKHKLIIETLKSIFNKFNSTNKTVETSANSSPKLMDDDLPF